METNYIEMQLWEYIDGSCAIDDMQRISILIERDSVWKAKYDELSVLHVGIASNLELEQPSMRFTQNVMDAVAAVHVAPATKQYINKGIIRGIAAVFIAMLTGIFGYAFANVKSLPGGAFSKLDLKNFGFGGFFNSPAFNIVIALNVIIALVLLDAILRRKRIQQAN